MLQMLLLFWCLVCGIITFVPVIAVAQDAATPESAAVTSTQESSSVSIAASADGPLVLPEGAVRIPSVFTRRAPTTPAELAEIQQHLKANVPKWKAATVSLTVNSRGGGAQGSGVIVSPDGIVLTAAHVSGRPDRGITITTSDGEKFEGLTLGRNTTQDAALVKIVSTRQDWPALPVATVSSQTGEWCATLGHPGGYQDDRGLVLRVGRVIFRNNWLIQTDCELIGGDSGGPLINMRGEVIGINTRIGESTEFNLHVPADVFTRDWSRYMKGEDFRTHSGAYLGLTGELAPDGKAVRVTGVVSGAAAEREGVLVGDLVTEFDNEKVESVARLNELVGRMFPGQSARMVVLRDGKTIIMQPRLGMRWND